jgi:hypothetical protein
MYVLNITSFACLKIILLLLLQGIQLYLSIIPEPSDPVCTVQDFRFCGSIVEDSGLLECDMLLGEFVTF